MQVPDRPPVPEDQRDDEGKGEQVADHMARHGRREDGPAAQPGFDHADRIDQHEALVRLRLHPAAPAHPEQKAHGWNGEQRNRRPALGVDDRRVQPARDGVGGSQIAYRQDCHAQRHPPHAQLAVDVAPLCRDQPYLRVEKRQPCSQRQPVQHDKRRQGRVGSRIADQLEQVEAGRKADEGRDDDGERHARIETPFGVVALDTLPLGGCRHIPSPGYYVGATRWAGMSVGCPTLKRDVTYLRPAVNRPKGIYRWNGAGLRRNEID